MILIPGADVLPDDPLDWLFDMLILVVWADDPVHQVAANLTLFIVALLSSTVTFGATVVLAILFGFFTLIGLARIVVMVLTGSEAIGPLVRRVTIVGFVLVVTIAATVAFGSYGFFAVVIALAVAVVYEPVRRPVAGIWRGA